MYWKVLLLCLACVCSLVQGVPVHDNELDTVPNDVVDQKIQEKGFDYMSVYLAKFLGSASANENIAFSPMTLQIAVDMQKIQMYNKYWLLFPNKNELLEEPKALAKMVNSMTSVPDIQMNVETAVFSDKGKSKKTFLDDMKDLYKSEIIELDFTQSSTVVDAINDWTSKKSNGAVPKLHHLPLPSLTKLADCWEMALATFSACWDNSKSVQSGKFKNGADEIDVEMMNAKAFIGYVNNPKLKYEAIRLPYKNAKFGMAVVLPYENESLKIFDHFTAQDYKELLEVVSSRIQLVDYKIPLLNQIPFVVNENGTSLNSGNQIICPLSSSQNSLETTNVDYKTFYVNRPYALFIYHEETKLILQYFLARNLSQQQLRFLDIETKIKIQGKEIQYSKK